jgi:pyridoxamine 5'-phosphate oxidase family protein
VKYSALRDIIDVTGREFAGSMTYGDVARAAAQAAIVIDDLASTDPWRPRGIEIRRAETVTEPHELIRSIPTACRLGTR